jgi:hypothetical protein
MSSKGTLLLALAGSGTALFLFFLFPRMTSSRAAEARRSAPARPASPVETEEARTVQALELVPAELPEETAATPEPVPVAEDPGASAEVAAVTEAKPRVEGPKLKYLKGEGSKEEIEPGALRAERRERRKAHLEEAAAKAAAFGADPAEKESVEAAPKPNRARLQQPNKGRTGERKRKPKDG